MKINLLSEKTPKNLDELKNILLENRSLKTKKEIDEFLNPAPPEKLTFKEVGIDPKEMKKAMKLIKNFIDEKFKIVIYSDYDADGVCSGAILWQALYSIGADVVPFIPSREEDGYGLSKSGIDKILALYPDQKILIITVDNGIVANEAANYLYSVGDDFPVDPMGQTKRSVPTKKQKNIRLQLIITDHHVKSEIIPKCDALIHTTNLCGAGVAWILAKEIFANFKIVNDHPEYQHTLDILTIATVSDMVPLIKFNRSIVKFGFEELKKTKRPGILAIFKEAGIDPQTIGTYTIGFVIGPRLNAMGRLSNALSSLRLLCTRDQKKAEEYARELGSTNRDRQSMTFEQTEMAVFSISQKYEKIEETKVLISVDSTYNQGVIGLIAGRLMEKFHRPAIVIARGEKVSKASTRSIQGFNIIENLRLVQDLLINCGGHPMAAGFTIETEKIELFKEKFIKIADRVLNEEILTKKINVECELDLKILSLDPRLRGDDKIKGGDDKIESIISVLNAFAPFGMQNPEPIFILKNVEIANLRTIGQDGKHLKFIVKSDSSSVDAVGFGLTQKNAGLKNGDRVSLIFTVSENTFNGKTSLQIKVKEII
jgi:single-stranded-DNA-specific exonuclease